MSHLFVNKNLDLLTYLLTGLLGLSSLIPAEVTASAAPDRVAIGTGEPAVEMKDSSISLTQSYSLKAEKLQTLQNLKQNFKVYLPEPEENSSNLPLSGENMPLNSLDPELNRFNQVMQSAINRQLTDRPFGEIMQAIAEQFIGTPYMAGLLDKSNKETLVVTLKGFDCVLFIETVLAIARGVAVQDYAYENFRDRIQEQRYRNGQLNGYCSRLHYFSDWIDDNQNRRIVYNISKFLGGIPLNNTLNFMTQNRQYYPQLANESEYECIVNQEAQLANLNIRYIPQDEIATIYPYLQPGDIIATATDIPGLDVTHTGLVYRFPDGGIGFIHASPSGGVKISRDLQSYVQAVDGQIGIIVARPL